MERQEVINKIKRYFDVVELVCPHTYGKWGERSWQFLDTGYLHNLLVIRRDILDAPMYCDNWDRGGKYSQRGLRCNLCQIVSDKTRNGVQYLSAHCLGKAGDFDVKGMTAEEARRKIIEKKDLLPYPARLEGNVGWLHVDSYDTGTDTKVVVF